METGFIILVIVAMIVGVAIGFIIGKSRRKADDTQGVIYAYYDDQSDEPLLLLEYSVPIDDIASRKRVTFDVTIIH